MIMSMTHAYGQPVNLSLLQSFRLLKPRIHVSSCLRLAKAALLREFWTSVFRTSGGRISSQGELMREHVKTILTAKFGWNVTVRSVSVLYTDAHKTFKLGNWIMEASLRLVTHIRYFTSEVNRRKETRQHHVAVGLCTVQAARRQ